MRDDLDAVAAVDDHQAGPLRGVDRGLDEVVMVDLGPDARLEPREEAGEDGLEDGIAHALNGHHHRHPQGDGGGGHAQAPVGFGVDEGAAPLLAHHQPGLGELGQGGAARRARWCG